jgi:phthiocerol/phenolphthiocerol synthesis type-I polyketide synthase C
VPDVRDQSSAQDIWNSLVADDPDYFQIVHSVGLVGMHLGELLAGQRTCVDVCPQESSLATLLRQVLGTRGKQKIGQRAARLIGRGLQDLPAGQRLGIVEISEGRLRSSWTRAPPSISTAPTIALPDLGGTWTRWPPQGVLRQPSQRSSLEAPPEAAGHGTGGAESCALAIVVLDFGSVEQALQAIDHARSRLAAGGSLIVIGQHPARWIDFVFGAQRAGWSQRGKRSLAVQSAAELLLATTTAE